MADHAGEDNVDGDNIFVYTGRLVPQHVTHVIIDKSVDEIEDNAFEDCENLLTVDTHNGIRRIGKQAFWRCKSLRRINIKSVVEVDVLAFNQCENLESVEFGDRLVAIGDGAFDRCKSLKHLKLPSIITIEKYAFSESKLTDVELSEGLETIGKGAFLNCERLQRIAIPLKRDLFVFHDYMNQFDFCINLTKVDIVGGIHETVASLHMESWRTDMIAEINRINQVLPDTPANEKTVVNTTMDGVDSQQNGPLQS